MKKKKITKFFDKFFFFIFHKNRIKNFPKTTY